MLESCASLSEPRGDGACDLNFQGLEKGGGRVPRGIGYLWDTYHIPCYNIASDHPYFTMTG